MTNICIIFLVLPDANSFSTDITVFDYYLYRINMNSQYFVKRFESVFLVCYHRGPKLSIAVRLVEPNPGVSLRETAASLRRLNIVVSEDTIRKRLLANMYQLRISKNILFYSFQFDIHKCLNSNKFFLTDNSGNILPIL